jgi:hypothetical protein
MDNEIKYTIIEDKKETPEWLLRIIESKREITMQMLRVYICNILEDSCFYYCSGNDITPIVALEKYIHSYVYCDNCLFQDYDEALCKLRQRLKKKDYIEIQKINTDNKILSIYNYYKENPRGEFSIWEKNGHYYSILYICWNDIDVWNNFYKKFSIYPVVVCNINPECSVMYGDVWNVLPKYVIGHPLLSERFEEVGYLEYFGDYEANSRLYKKI